MAAPSFSEWSQGGQQQNAGPVATGPSFSEWSQGAGNGAQGQAQVASGYNGYTPQEMRWLLEHGQGEASEADYNDPTFQAMLKRGAISVGDPREGTTWNPSTGSGTEKKYDVKTSFEMPKVMAGYGGKGYGYSLAYDPSHGFDSGDVTFDGGKSVPYGNLKYDPVYGPVHYFETSKADRMIKGLAQSAAIGMAMAPIAMMAGPALASATGLPGPVASGAVKAIPGLVMSGGKSAGGTLASLAGSATGVPFGGQAASLLYSTAMGNKVDPVRAGLGAAPGFASWLAQQAGGS